MGGKQHSIPTSVSVCMGNTGPLKVAEEEAGSENVRSPAIHSGVAAGLPASSSQKRPSGHTEMSANEPGLLAQFSFSSEW